MPCTHTGTKEEDNFVLHFKHKCECEPGDTIYFALSYPHSYTDCIARYARLDTLFGLPPAAVAAAESATGGTVRAPEPTAAAAPSTSAPVAAPGAALAGV